MNGRDIALFSAQAADEKKATDIVVYDLHGITDITDYFVIITAQSKAQAHAIVETISRALKAQGVQRMGREGEENGQWVLLDYCDCVVHVFSPALRDYYALESLWGDAPKLDWQNDQQPAAARQGE